MIDYADLKACAAELDSPYWEASAFEKQAQELRDMVEQHITWCRERLGQHD